MSCEAICSRFWFFFWELGLRFCDDLVVYIDGVVFTSGFVH